MSKSEILAELPRLSRQDRRELAEAIFQLEDEADVLRDCDQRANDCFLMLDALETEDAKTKSA
jgi:hypothetical protein